MKMPELRHRAHEAGVQGASRLRKAELVEALASAPAKKSAATKAAPARRAAAEKTTAKKQKAGGRAQSGATLTTKDHDEIQSWTEARRAEPATVPGTEHGDHLGVLRFDFPGYGGDDLEHVSWDDWFDTIDRRDLEFKYQNTLADGKQSNFFVLTNPDRDDD